MRESVLPPLPPPHARGSQVCSIVQLYLAVLDDLPFEQVQAVLEHVYECSLCLQEYQLFNRTTRLLKTLGESEPSPRVTQAVRQSIAARWGLGESLPLSTLSAPSTPLPVSQISRSIPARVSGRRRWSLLLSAAAVLLLLLLSAMLVRNFLLPSSSSAFALPAQLSWGGYVLYHSQTRMGSQGQPYRVETYHNLGTGELHVETTLPGRLDVVVVSDGRQMLGLDMMHQIAQWNPAPWSTIASDDVFDLSNLRRDLQSGRAVYLGTGRFQGQQVYRIHLPSNEVLLLDMHYRPVNLLYASGSQQGQPVYDRLRLLRTSQVSEDMWRMSLPPGFHLGTLPEVL